MLVVERECSAFNSVVSPSNRDCSRELFDQAREMVRMGHEHAQTVLTRLGDLLDNLTTVRAPKHLVLFSGGIAFDVNLLSRYRDLATKAAQARVSIFVVHLDQPAFDASDRMVETVFSSREFTTGLGDIASRTGGVFVEALGTAAGPLDAGLRAAGAVLASDLIVGLPVDGRVAPRARLTQGDHGVALLELSSAEPLTGTTGVVELTRAGTAQPAVRGMLELRAQARNDTVVAAQARLDLSGLAPGTYMASAVLDRSGTPFARISRLVEVVPGVASPVPASVESTPAPPSPKTSTIRDPALEDVLQRVGRYVASYGEQASLIVGVERYEQRYQNAPAGERGERKLLAELALFKTSDSTGWVGFRDVIAVDGKPIPDRQDRLQALLRSSTPDVREARRIADESARFNIGPTRRNFNEPTAALFFFTPVHQTRFTFTRKGMTAVNGVTAMEIDFHETGSPTLIRTTDGRDMVSDGTIWVVPADGTVLRTRLTVRGFVGPASSATVDVTSRETPG